MIKSLRFRLRYTVIKGGNTINEEGICLLVAQLDTRQNLFMGANISLFYQNIRNMSKNFALSVINFAGCLAAPML